MVIINNPRVSARTIPKALHWEIGSAYDEIKVSEGAEMYDLCLVFATLYAVPGNAVVINILFGR